MKLFVLQENSAQHKDGKLGERASLWSDCTIYYIQCILREKSHMVQFPKYKGHIHHYLTALFCNHTHWAVTHNMHKLPQHHSEQVNASCTETTTKVSLPFRLVKTFHMQISLSKQLLHWLISLALVYENSGISGQSQSYLEQKSVQLNSWQSIW